MDLRKMVQVYQEDGLAVDLASARVCQDIVLIHGGNMQEEKVIKIEELGFEVSEEGRNEERFTKKEIMAGVAILKLFLLVNWQS